MQWILDGLQGECEMRQASFRGVPFWVIGNGGENGRDIAIHNYPLKDSTWVEDLGRSQRRYDLHGFLMGNDQTSLKTMLQIAVEQEGPGLLIHPSLGILNVSVVSYKWREPDYTSNRSDIDISFIEYSNPVAGLVSSLTNSFIGELSDAFSGSAVGDFLNDTTNIFDNGMMKQAVSVASDWGAMAFTQGMGSIPLAGLGTVATESIGERLLNLAVNRDSLKDTLQMIDPSFDQNSMSTIQEK